ncbi:MAG: DUF1800 domain-containing protein [Steroidobacter sp.]
MLNARLNAVIAANRFGLGARQDELSKISNDPQGWLNAQVEGARATPEAIAQLATSPQAFKVFSDFIREKRELKKDDLAKTDAREELTPARKAIRDTYLSQVAARYEVATFSEEPFRERLVHFWSNHFAVSVDKFVVSTLAGTMENEAIRPNLHGHFYDLLVAAESHPAMILFLDNQASIGADSRLAQLAHRRGKNRRKLDINENLAREILELHTLGVNGGYTQQDVTRFARVLTGWSVGGGQGFFKTGEQGAFVFRDNLHEPGSQTILGKRYAQQGVDQPLAVFRDLSRHPATAHFIATKLVRHFVADDPPAKAVDHVATVFRDTEGHLPSVHQAVVSCKEAWIQVSPKFKTPNDYVISTFRAFDFIPPQPQRIFASFELLGQRPYTPGSPAGWPDTASQWDGPDALMKRIEWANQVAQRAGSRFVPVELAQRTLGGALSEHTQLAIDNAADAVQGITLWLASPEFLRR